MLCQLVGPLCLLKSCHQTLPKACKCYSWGSWIQYFLSSLPKSLTWDLFSSESTPLLSQKHSKVRQNNHQDFHRTLHSQTIQLLVSKTKSKDKSYDTHFIHQFCPYRHRSLRGYWWSDCQKTLISPTCLPYSVHCCDKSNPNEELIK